jgi:hypothetical protein
MNDGQTFETAKVANVDREQLGYIVNIHARCDPRVMHTYAFDFVFHKKTSPAVMDNLAVWKKFEILFDFLSQKVGFGNTQPEPVLVPRARGDIPEFT